MDSRPARRGAKATLQGSAFTVMTAEPAACASPDRTLHATAPLGPQALSAPVRVPERPRACAPRQGPGEEEAATLGACPPGRSRDALGSQRDGARRGRAARARAGAGRLRERRAPARIRRFSSLLSALRSRAGERKRCAGCLGAGLKLNPRGRRPHPLTPGAGLSPLLIPFGAILPGRECTSPFSVKQITPVIPICT
ncbi:Hypothetical predicted protein [Marmota monax]|uniref:Uncharacterized protein n=1 Tax=Marmota monax TaxID=9995 RepID=A0A5E4CIK8_MARMO|nr:hypothetical protein GHT09_017429 [Marmota monax]VTJ81684.1 Hypothetical predicted protein [Marmota monax]